MIVGLPRSEELCDVSRMASKKRSSRSSRKHRSSRARRYGDAKEVYLQQGERVRIRSKGPQGQPFEAFWYTVPYAMTPSEVALQFAQTGQPGMFIEVVSGKLKWTYQEGRFAGQPSVTAVPPLRRR